MLSWIRNLGRFRPAKRTARPHVSRRLNLKTLEIRAVMSTNVFQTNLVSDLPGVAQLQDPNLVNPWGIAESAGSPFWISDNNAGVSTLYGTNAAGAVSINSLVVGIPGPPDQNATVGGIPVIPQLPTDPNGSAGTPTGIVNNGTNSFVLSFTPAGATTAKTGKAAFIFATEDGTIAAWAPGIQGTEAIIAVDNSQTNEAGNLDPVNGAVYKGLAIASGASTTTDGKTTIAPIFANDPNSTSVIYASNFRGGAIDVFDTLSTPVTTFSKVALPAGAFSDPNLPKGYAPFDVQVINGKVFVTYALQDTSKHDDVAGAHHGFVDVYNLDGTPGLTVGGKATQRLITGGALDSPWGLAIAPASFGLGSNALLVGNFGDGHINVYDASTGSSMGELLDPDGEPIQIDGLWALKVGNGGAGGLSNTVYFTAGLAGETHGLFGSLAFATPGSPEGNAEFQMTVGVDTALLNLDLQQLQTDLAKGANDATIKQDLKTIKQAQGELKQAEAQAVNEALEDLGFKPRKRNH